MKKTLLICSLLLVLGIYVSCKKAEVNSLSTSTTNYVIGKDPIWQDEFDYNGAPDAKKWGYDIGGSGWGNNEAEYYTNDPKNAHVENGKLTIEALKESVGGKKYSSARLVTKNKGDWTYGKFEIRAKLPSGLGTWPAIWMLATKQSYGTAYWPDNGEIDIMEHVGYDPNVIHASLHTKAFNFKINTQKTNVLTVPTAFTDFHNYTCEWYPDSMKIFVDNQAYLTVVKGNDWGWEKWPYDQPFHILLNLAIGGDWGGQKGIDDSIFPQKMEVDYVRVYPLQKK